MIWGIEQSTDMRNPRTVIKKFSTRKSALKWASESGGYSDKGAANNALPVPSQNWHHSFRYVWETNGWRSPSVAKLDEMAWKISTSTYPRYARDVLASLIEKNGTEVKP